MKTKPKQSDPPIRQKRVGRLETVGQIRTELGRILREMRRGELPTADGMRMAQVLQIMMQSIRDHEFEAKLAELERARSAPSTHTAPPVPGWQPSATRVAA